MIAVEGAKALPEWCREEVLNAALTEGYAAIREMDPFLPRQLIRRPDKHLQRRDQNWARLRDLVTQEPEIYDPKTRGALVQEALTRSGVRRATSYAMQRQYWQRGMTPDALLPDWHLSGARGTPRRSATGKKRGRPSRNPNVVGINVDEEIVRLIRMTVKKLYNNRKMPSIRQIVHALNDQYFIAGYREDDGVMVPIPLSPNDRPSESQIRYHVRKELDLVESTKLREGIQRTERNKREQLGDPALRSVGSPGARFEIDATPADVCLVSRHDRYEVLGRPTIYTVIDVFSRLATGLYVGWESPSWMGAMMALENMMTDKVEFCAAHGITIREDEWPSHHVPRALVSDRGEVFSKSGDQLVKHLNVDRITAPPYRGDLKPYIERYFRTLSNDERQLPGGVQNRDRGESDYRLTATLTIDELTKILIYLVLEHNNTVVSRRFAVPPDLVTRGVPLTPAAIWQWGVEHRAGSLRTVPLAQLRYSLLPHRTARVTREGVLVETLRFTADWARDRQWFAKAAIAGNEVIDVAYDPRTVDGLWWQDGDGTVRSLEIRPDDYQRFGGLTWLEASALRAQTADRRAATKRDRCDTRVPRVQWYEPTRSEW